MVSTSTKIVKSRVRLPGGIIFRLRLHHDLTIALTWLNNSIECFRKAGKVGLICVGKAHVHTEVLRVLHNGVQKEDHESALVELVKRCITQAMM